MTTWSSASNFTKVYNGSTFTPTTSIRVGYDAPTITNNGSTATISIKVYLQAKCVTANAVTITGQANSDTFWLRTTNPRANVVETTGFNVSKKLTTTSWTDIGNKTLTFTRNLTTSSVTEAYEIEYAYLWTQGDETTAGRALAVQSLNITLPAKKSYTVTYNANGGSGAPSSQTKWHGTNITLSSTQPTRTSYQFRRWNTNTADSGTAYSPGATYTANAALSLYAIWNPIIGYNANGGSGAPSSQTKTFGTALTLSSTVPTRSGYSFATWNTASDGTGSSYASGGSYTSNTAATLYAIWTPIISYNANGGSGAPEAQTKPLSQALTLSSTVPTKSGCIFREWNTAADGTGTSYQPGGTYSSTSTATLYAIWDYALTISSFTVERTDSNGDADAVGTYLKCTAVWSTTVEGVSAEFSCGSVTGTEELSGSSGTAVKILSVAAVPTSDYTATVVVEDEVTSKTASATTTAASTGYVLPAIQAISVARCDSQGAIEDDGTYALVTVAWRVAAVGSQTTPQSLTIKAYDGVAEIDSDTVTTFSSASGTYTHVMGYGSTFSTDKPYTFTATLADVAATAVKSDVMPIAYFTFDVLAGGHGVAFGKPASQSELMDVGYDIHSDGEVEATDASDNLHKLTEKANQSDVDDLANDVGELVTGVSGVKGNAETNYRAGNVNLTPANIGAAPASHSHSYLPLSGGTLTGKLQVMHSSTSYIAGLTNPAIYQPHPSSNAWSPIIAWRTKSQGGWSLGSYDTDNAQFSFGTSANISANNNATTIVNLRPTAGTIALTSEVDGRVPKPAVLYNNGTGTNGTVTLSASAANYNHMRIHYRSNNSYYGSVVVYVPNGKKVTMTSGWANSSTYCEFAMKVVLVNGTSITNDAYGVFSQTGTNGNNYIYIVRVEAWNE